MPLYEYKCQSCGAVFEKIQKFSDAPVTLHENCGGSVEKLISTSALKFKGSGWYVNDYAKSSGGSPGSSSDSAKSDSAKTDSKDGAAPSTAAKTETKSDTAAPAASAPVSTKKD